MRNVSVVKVSKVIRGPPSNHQGRRWSFCRRQMIYFNQARQRAETCIKIVLHVDIEQFST